MSEFFKLIPDILVSNARDDVLQSNFLFRGQADTGQRIDAQIVVLRICDRMDEADRRNPAFTKHMVEPFEDQIFLIMEQGGIGAGNGDVERGLGLVLSRFGLPVMKFDRLGAACEFRPDDVVPVGQNPPERDKLAREGLFCQCGDGMRNGAKIRHSPVVKEIMAKSHALPEEAFQSKEFAAEFRSLILAWYDRNRRVLPWRAAPGQAPDPYHVWLSEIMLQQTTVQAVIPYFEKFVAAWPSARHLAQADPDHVMRAWAGLGYYARARNLLKCAAAICDIHDGIFPKTEEGLLALPGIGPYTSAAIAAIAFDIPATVVDGNIERVVSRVCLIEEPLPASKPIIRRRAGELFADAERPGDFAQALMDLGATVCIPQTPRCGVCPVNALCRARQAGMQGELPRKVAKKERPRRTGEVYWLRCGDQIVIERRQDNRMLGGMPGLPTTDWDKGGKGFSLSPHLRKRLRKTGVIHHTFTHFDLSLEVLEGDVVPADLPQAQDWKFMPLSDIDNAGFPTLFSKVVKLRDLDRN